MVWCKSAVFLLFMFFVNLYKVNCIAVPDVQFEVLKTGGFRVYITDNPAIILFAFHGNINAGIFSPQPGEIHGEVTTPTNGYLILKFDNHLQIGDVVNSWVLVATDRLGVRKDHIQLNVTELLDSYTTDLNLEPTQPNGVTKDHIQLNVTELLDSYTTDLNLQPTQPNGVRKDSSTTDLNLEPTQPNGVGKDHIQLNVTEPLDSRFTDLNLEPIQPNVLFFEDNFDGYSLNTHKWKVEHRIPTYAGSSYEFNSYENRDETRFVKNGKLYLKPIAKQSLNEVRGTLDLREGCTSTEESQCFCQSSVSFLLPPVKSAKVTLKTPFKYGKVEIRAKLPAGDWIFPIIQLEPKENNGENLTALWIAYSRGNDHLTKEKADIGASLLFAGPMIHPLEPARSKRLITRTSTFPYNNDFHIYTLDWAPGEMTFFFDGEEYGNIPISNQGFVEPSLGVGDTWKAPGAPFDKEYVLSLGVGVGGFNDFPDYFKSGDNPKPWVNWERDGVRKFFDARNVWLSTWNGEDVALQVDYVKIWL